MKRIVTDLKIQSIPRSGTTLLRNLLIPIFQDETGSRIEMSHGVIVTNGPLLVNVRDFRDITASLWRINHAKYDKEGKVKNKMSKLDVKGNVNSAIQNISSLNQTLHSNPQALLVRYEEYWDNPDRLLDQIEGYLDIKIPKELREAGKANCDIKKMKALGDELEDWDKVDEETDIHGKHIYTGKPGTWKEFVEKDLRKRLNLKLRRYLKEYGYKSIYSRKK